MAVSLGDIKEVQLWNLLQNNLIMMWFIFQNLLSFFDLLISCCTQKMSDRVKLMLQKNNCRKVHRCVLHALAYP